jgi:hypothetical protein
LIVLVVVPTHCDSLSFIYWLDHTFIGLHYMAVLLFLFNLKCHARTLSEVHSRRIYIFCFFFGDFHPLRISSVKLPSRRAHKLQTTRAARLHGVLACGVQEVTNRKYAKFHTNGRMHTRAPSRCYAAYLKGSQNGSAETCNCLPVLVAWVVCGWICCAIYAITVLARQQ